VGTYQAGWSHAGVNTADTIYANLNNTASTARLRIKEIGVNISVAPTTAPLFYLVRTTARGTQTTTLAGLPLDPSDPTPTGTLDSAWSVAATKAGTIATASLAAGGLAVTAGGMLIWTFYEFPLTVTTGAGNGLALVNSLASGATTGTFNGYVKWDE
jgi:hypothetical protein